MLRVKVCGQQVLALAGLTWQVRIYLSCTLGRRYQTRPLGRRNGRAILDRFSKALAKLRNPSLSEPIPETDPRLWHLVTLLSTTLLLAAVVRQSFSGEEQYQDRCRKFGPHRVVLREAAAFGTSHYICGHCPRRMHTTVGSLQVQITFAHDID